MEDLKKPNLQPVIATSEAWHLAQVQAFERAAGVIKAAKPEGSTPGLSEYCSAVEAALNEQAGAAWVAYLRFAERPSLTTDRDSVLVEYDEGRSMPMVEWPDDGDAGWGVIDLVCAECPDMVLAVPFRPVNLERLPKGGMMLRLQDPHHAATAALVEVLQCARRDAINAFIAPDPRVAWRRLNNVINIYRQAARFGLESLREDDYIGWRPTMPSSFEIGTAAGLICQIVGTAKGQCSLATHILASWLQAAADNIEEHIPSEGRKVALMRLIEDSLDPLEAALGGMNRGLALSYWQSAEDFDCMVVYRPVPKSIPTLAVIPKPSITNVTALPKAKKVRK